MSASWIEKFIISLNEVCERKCASDKAVAELCGISIEELDADTTALDEHDEED